MGAGKKLCCGIMICQMTAILSGVALMYLSVIIITPSLREIKLNINRDPIMCTTVKANDIAAGGKKVECHNSTCHEWCLSKSSSPCMQIYAMPRKVGHNVSVTECQLLSETPTPCSALNVSLTNKRLCKKGECKDMTGVFNCSKLGLNVCREITPAYECIHGNFKNVNATPVHCNAKKCITRLSGVYLCSPGICRKIEDKETYEDCTRKCDDLDLTEANTILFSKENLIIAHCSSANSTNGTLTTLNTNEDWKAKRKYLFLFCSYVTLEEGEGKTSEIAMEDCFNASLRDRADVAKIKSFLTLIKTRDNIPSTADWLIEPEESLRIMNDTKLKINYDGCVNTLIRECHAFFLTHATDGKDGKTADRYPCYYADNRADFVIGKFEPEKTYLYLLLGSIIPATLFVVSCSCLFFCSKSVGVDEAGHLKVTLLKKRATPGHASEL